MKIVVITPHFPPLPGGVSDYALQWVLAMRALADPPEIVVITHSGAQPGPGFELRAVQDSWGPRAWRLLCERVVAERPDVVFLHYEPHMFQRRGLALIFTPALVLLGRAGIPLVTLAHELYYGRDERLKAQPVGWVQRLALLPLFGSSARVVFSVPDRLVRMRAIFPCWAARFRQLPIGRNMTPTTHLDLAAYRAAKGVPEDATLLLFMGLLHPSKDVPAVLATLEHLQALGREVRLLVIGGGRIEHPWALNMGYVAASEAADALAAAELVLLPLTDGASTRRTSLLNALGAGLPIVSTIGRNTDLALLAPAVHLVPGGDTDAFKAAVADMVADPAARQALGAHGQALFDEQLSWPVLARAWRAVLLEAIAARA